MENEGLDCWTVFTLIDFDDLATIVDFTPFTISVLKLRCLTALKFWIEDKIRMNKPHIAAQFTQDTITTYTWLYEVFVAARDNNSKIVHESQFNLDDWSGFEIGTIECLGSIQGSGGVPLSYILRDDVHPPDITTASSCDIKILWNAPLVGTNFNIDSHRVWISLSQQCRETIDWLRIR